MSIMEGREDSDEYEEFISTYLFNCDINHHGSAGSIKADGIIEYQKRTES